MTTMTSNKRYKQKKQILKRQSSNHGMAEPSCAEGGKEKLPSHAVAVADCVTKLNNYLKVIFLKINKSNNNKKRSREGVKGTKEPSHLGRQSSLLVNIKALFFSILTQCKQGNKELISCYFGCHGALPDSCFWYRCSTPTFILIWTVCFCMTIN